MPISIYFDINKRKNIILSAAIKKTMSATSTLTERLQDLIIIPTVLFLSSVLAFFLAVNLITLEHAVMLVVVLAITWEVAKNLMSSYFDNKLLPAVKPAACEQVETIYAKMPSGLSKGAFSAVCNAAGCKCS
jgi:hypothetical protein